MMHLKALKYYLLTEIKNNLLRVSFLKIWIVISICDLEVELIGARESRSRHYIARHVDTS